MKLSVKDLLNKFPTYQDERRERAKKIMKEVAKMKKEEFVKGDKVQIISSKTEGEFIGYSEKKSKHKSGRKVAVAISGVYDLSMREKEIVKVNPYVGNLKKVLQHISSTVPYEEVIGLPTPKTILGWRTEDRNLKLGYDDNRPIVIGEALSVQEAPATKTTYAKTIAVGGFGLHAYTSFDVLLSQSKNYYISLVELSGKIASSEENHKRSVSAETRRCLGLVAWRPVFKQLYARLMLPYAKELSKRYPELSLLVEILESRSKGEKENVEARSTLKKYLYSRLTGARDQDRYSGFGLPMPMMMAYHGPIAFRGTCNAREALDDMEEMQREMSKPPREYSIMIDMLMHRHDNVKEEVIRELLGAKVFEQAKKFAKKVEILEKALKDVSDLKLDELPKYLCRRVHGLLEDNGDSEYADDKFYDFMYAAANYDSFDQSIKEALEEKGISDVGLKDKYKEFVKEVNKTLESELLPIMKKSLETKTIIEKI